eukprot:snap_masked-scaffold1541_size36691-processed-gene-0.1 protein:Tk04155 transcript:snap_masked-scaffold1541_size36691-processed-gene-0.1-mRNA-1 annotation:"predicted protein"
MDGANAVCRICGTSGPGLVHMYSAEGKTRQILAKIRYCFSKESITLFETKPYFADCSLPLTMGNKGSKATLADNSDHLTDGPGSGAARNVADNLNLDEEWNKIDGAIPRKVTAVVIGAGNRGQNYANFALDFPSRLSVVGVAECQPHRLDRMRERFDLAEEVCFKDWRDLVAQEKMADLAIVATQDQMHKEPAMALAQKGYHLILEKPMAVDEAECEAIAQACQEHGTIVAVCHVLRYFPPCVKIRELIDSGVIGEVVTINHVENILFWHFAHSFVRGNWRQEASSTFSLLAKCCHDIDLIMYWMGDRKCRQIQSFGGLYHFKESQKPTGAAKRCFDCGVEKDCPYSAQKVYMKSKVDRPEWPMSVVCDIEDHPGGYQAALREALEDGPYGRCVYDCDNDVADHQMVNMEFESGATATMTMNAFTRNMSRETRICGTKGELRWGGSPQGPIHVYDFATQSEKEVLPDLLAPPCRTSGHGGADFFLVNAILKAVASEDPTLISSGILDSLRSHKLRPRELKLPNIFDEECPRKSISSNQELTTPEMPTQSLADTHPRPDPPPYSIPDSLTFPHFSQSLQGQCNEPESGCLEFEASTKHSVQSRLGASIGFDKLSNGTPSSQKNLVSSCGSFRPVAHSRTTVSASALGSHPIPSATISQSRIANVPPIIATVSPTSPGNFHIRPGFDPRTSPSSLGGSGLNLKAMPLANPNPLALGNVNYLQPKLAANVTLPDGSRIHVPIVNGSQLPDLQFLQAHLKNSEILKVEPSPRPEEEVMRPISLLSLGSGSFKCTQCNISFKNADARTMVKHCLTAHGTEKTLFGCPVCTQRCDSPQKIMEHMKNSHSSALANPPPPPVKQECSVCHEAYTTRAAMKIHMQNAHFATGLHECPTCKRMFSSRATLKRHQLTHAGARPHSCSICGSHFTQKSALAAHMKTHHANQTDSLSASTTDEN